MAAFVKVQTRHKEPHFGLGQAFWHRLQRGGLLANDIDRDRMWRYGDIDKVQAKLQVQLASETEFCKRTQLEAQKCNFQC